MENRIKANLLEFLERIELKGYKEAIAMVEIINSLNDKGEGANEQRANPEQTDND